VLIWLGCSQSAVALQIYRVGTSVPTRSWNPNKSLVQIQLLTRIGHFRPIWPVYELVWPGCRSSGRHNFLIRTPNWTLYICIPIFSTRSTQWFSPIGDLVKSSRLVWLISRTGLTGLPRLSSKPELCQFWVSTIWFIFVCENCDS